MIYASTFRQLRARTLKLRQHLFDERWLDGPSSSGNPKEEWTPPVALNCIRAVRGVDIPLRHQQRKASDVASCCV